MQGIGAGLRFAWRLLWKSPRFTTMAILSLALSMAAAAVTFSLLDPLLLQPLGYADSHRLVALSETHPDALPSAFPGSLGLRDFVPLSPAKVEDLRALSRVFEDLATARPAIFSLQIDGSARSVSGTNVSSNFFDVLGVEPLLGRTLRVEDEGPLGAAVAVLSHRLWQDRFAGDPAVIGSEIVLADERFLVVGVMPPHFGHPIPDPDLWVPLHLDLENTPRIARFLTVIGRLSKGVSLDEASEELDALSRELGALHPHADLGWRVVPVPLAEWLLGPYRLGLALMAQAAALLLFFACLNVTALMIARGNERQTELALRTAFGARRAGLAAQILTESALLAGLGGLGGLLLALFGVELLADLYPAEASWLPDVVRVDGRVAVFTLALSTVAALVQGVLPAWHLSRPDVARSLRQGDERVVNPPRRRRIQEVLVTAQVVVAVVLLVGGGHATKRLLDLSRIDPGFDADSLLVVDVALSPDQIPYHDALGVANFQEVLLARIRVLPDVEAASTINYLPLRSLRFWVMFDVSGRPPPPAGEFLASEFRVVGRDYLDTMKIPLRRGRGFDARDRAGSEPVVIVNEAFARRFFAGRDPLGRRLAVLGDARPRMIVGIAADARNVGLHAPIAPEIYGPSSQTRWTFFSVVVRTRGDTASLAASVQRQLALVDPRVPPVAVTTMRRVVEASIAPWRIGGAVALSLSGVALILAMAGVYSRVDYWITERTREIGLYRALGAGSNTIVGLLARGALSAAGLGLAIGLPASFLLSHSPPGSDLILASPDARIYALAFLLLAAVACAACFFPAHRVTRLEPMRALLDRGGR